LNLKIDFCWAEARSYWVILLFHDLKVMAIIHLIMKTETDDSAE